MRDILKKLSEIGVEEKAAQIYTFLLHNQDIPVYKIATGTKIPRTTVYNLLNSLESQGLVSSWKKNNVIHYSAENPDRLRQILKNKENILNEIFGDLSNMYKLDKDNPKTKIFVGVEGLKQTFEHNLDTMIKNKTKLVYSVFEADLINVLPKFFPEWRKRKNKMTEAFTYLIGPKDILKNEHYKNDGFRETRELVDSSAFGGSMNVIGDTTYFFSFKGNEPYSIIIESKIVADMLTKLFMYIWKSLEPTLPQIRKSE